MSDIAKVASLCGQDMVNGKSPAPRIAQAIRDAEVKLLREIDTMAKKSTPAELSMFLAGLSVRLGIDQERAKT